MGPTVLPSSNPKPACFCEHSSAFDFCDHNEGMCTLASECGGRWICRDSPTTIPTPVPQTHVPTASPTPAPATAAPSSSPTTFPSSSPTAVPSSSPTTFPSSSPSTFPSSSPTAVPTPLPATPSPTVLP